MENPKITKQGKKERISTADRRRRARQIVISRWIRDNGIPGKGEIEFLARTLSVHFSTIKNDVRAILADTAVCPTCGQPYHPQITNLPVSLHKK